MFHASAITESIVAPTHFRPEFSHSLDPKATSALPKEVEHGSLTTLREKLVKIGATVVSHGRYVTFQMAEVAVSRKLFTDILPLIDGLRQKNQRRLEAGRSGMLEQVQGGGMPEPREHGRFPVCRREPDGLRVGNGRQRLPTVASQSTSGQNGPWNVS